jgi:5-methylcytosine-specific restriction endonuclease McrA
MARLRFAKPQPKILVQRAARAQLVDTIKVVRATVWRRDQGRCRACGRRRGAQIHHVRFRSHGGRWTVANCVWLCRACHQDVHAGLWRVTGANANAPHGVQFTRRRWW